MKKLKSIMLIDDDEATNYIHNRIIKQSGLVDNVMVKDKAEDALDTLTKEDENIPDLIFLDINMPGMDGWEFIEYYKGLKLNKNTVLIMMTTSLNPDDEIRARSYKEIADFQSKPLRKENLAKIIQTYFN